jgi:hypothetical protein
MSRCRPSWRSEESIDGSVWVMARVTGIGLEMGMSHGRVQKVWRGQEWAWNHALRHTRAVRLTGRIDRVTHPGRGGDVDLGREPMSIVAQIERATGVTTRNQMKYKILRRCECIDFIQYVPPHFCCCIAVQMHCSADFNTSPVTLVVTSPPWRNGPGAGSG